MRNKNWQHPGPSKRFFLLFLFLILIAYIPIRVFAVPAVSEIWFRQVTCRLVTQPQVNAYQNKLWLGATRPELPQSLMGINELNSIFKQNITMVSFYQAWGDSSEHLFPINVMDNMHKAGYTPMITWEPWLSAFKKYSPVEPSSSLSIILRGDLDYYIRDWARSATKFGKPFFIRIAHEPNNPMYPWSSPYGNTSEEYRQVWKHIRNIFVAEGAKNAIFVWTPFGLTDMDYFPGKDQVDWIAFDIFNEGALSERGTWIDFYSLTKLYVDQYRTLKLPMFIAEVGTSSAGGSKYDWFRDMFRSIKNHELPEIQGIVLFDIPTGRTATGLPIDWSISELQNLSQLEQEEKISTLFSTESKNHEE